jgi:hypothetical protein
MDHTEKIVTVLYGRYLVMDVVYRAITEQQLLKSCLLRGRCLTVGYTPQYIQHFPQYPIHLKINKKNGVPDLFMKILGTLLTPNTVLTFGTSAPASAAAMCEWMLIV